MAITLGKNGLPIGSGLYWNGKSIYCTISRGDGRPPLRMSTQTDKWKDAIAFRDAQISKINRGEVSADNKRVKISTLLDDYIAHLRRNDESKLAYSLTDSTHYKTSSGLKYIRAVFGDLLVHKLTTALLNDYVDTRLREKASRVTINRELSYMRAALRLGMNTTPKKVTSCPKFPIDAKAEKIAAKTGVITADQYTRIYDKLPDHLKPVFVFAIYTGTRTKELKWIRPEQIDWEANRITLRAGETKNGESRIVPMNDLVRAELLKWKEYTDEWFPGSEWFFNFKGKQLGSYKTAWNATLLRAGLRVKVTDENGKPAFKNLVRFHDTRRTNVTVNDEIGVTETDQQRNTGHKTVGVLRQYNQSKLSAERIRIKQNEALAARAETKPTQTEPTKSTMSIVDKIAAIKDLGQMMKDGLLTPDEFAVMKSAL